MCAFTEDGGEGKEKRVPGISSKKKKNTNYGSSEPHPMTSFNLNPHLTTTLRVRTSTCEFWRGYIHLYYRSTGTLSLQEQRGTVLEIYDKCHKETKNLGSLEAYNHEDSTETAHSEQGANREQIHGNRKWKDWEQGGTTSMSSKSQDFIREKSWLAFLPASLGQKYGPQQVAHATWIYTYAQTSSTNWIQCF